MGWSDFEIFAIIMSTHSWLEPVEEKYPAVAQFKDKDWFVHTTERWEGKYKELENHVKVISVHSCKRCAQCIFGYA